MVFGDEQEPGETEPAPVPPAANAPSFGRLPVKVNAPAPVFHPLAYRGVVAEWPVEWRERWGRRANALEETGLSWRDAEAQAFVEIWHDVRAQQNQNNVAATAKLAAAADAERN
jgi:hypothetical protein